MHERAEVVIGEDHLRGLFRDLAPAPHRDTDVGLFQRRGIVDGIACHCDDHALALHDLHESEFVVWSHSPEDMEVGQSLDDLLIGEVAEVCTADRSRPEPEILPDGERRCDVIPGDHPYIDTCI